MSMKKMLLILLILSYPTIIAQSFSTVKGTAKIFTNGEMELPMARLLQNGKYTDYTAQTGPDGNFSIPDVPVGRYYLMLSTSTSPARFYDLEVTPGETLFSVTVPGACVSYSKKICPFGHKDRLIPILYGELTKQELRKISKDKARSGWTGRCERWHCVKHDIDF